MIQQVYFPYQLWEEWHYGMWRNVYGQQRELLLQEAISFTRNSRRYGQYMRKIAKLWSFSCLHNLSNNSLNRQAWIGQAACCLAVNCPEDITRIAWHQLTKEQQDRANHQADKTITAWEQSYSKGIQLCLRLI